MSCQQIDFREEYLTYKSLYNDLKTQLMRGGAKSKSRKRTTDTLSQLFKRVVSYGHAMVQKGVDAKVAWRSLETKLKDAQPQTEFKMDWSVNFNVGGASIDKVLKHVKSGLNMQPQDPALQILIELVECLKEPCTVVSLCKVAFLVGQHKGHLKKNPDSYSEQALAFVKDNSLKFVGTYVNADLAKKRVNRIKIKDDVQ